MARRTNSNAPFALTLDGNVLLNVSARLGPAALSRVAKALAVDPADLFVGLVLPAEQHGLVRARVDDAAAEVAARIHGRAAASAPAQKPNPSRTRAKR